MNFNFAGKISSSKSLVNRYLILKQGHPNLNLKWSSDAKDVELLDEALSNFKKETDLYVGQGGTTLRFLAVYLSSQTGKWELKGEKALFKRPQEDLEKTLKQLGASVTVNEDSLVIESKGWSEQNKISVSCVKTSQIATAVVLTALSVKKEIDIELIEYEKASKYFELTINFLKIFGVSLNINDNKLKVLPLKSLSTDFKEIEGDWSSAAFIYSFAVLFGSADILNVSSLSSQPDKLIFEILQKMGVDFEGDVVLKTFNLKPFEIDLKNAPDLFPVLSVLAAFAEGESVLKGAPQLRFKETDRIHEVASLLSQCGYKVVELPDGVSILGCGREVLKHDDFEFDCSKDHRLVMAAFLLKNMGYKIKILGIESINKSFPEFFEIFQRRL